MHYFPRNNTPFSSNIPLCIIISMAEEIRIIQELEIDIDEEIDVNEFLALAFDTVRHSHIAEQQISFAMDLMLNRTSFPLDINLSKRLNCFENVATRIKDKLNFLNLYVCGKAPYHMYGRSAYAIVLFREDHYRRVINEEIINYAHNHQFKRRVRTE